MIVVGNTPGDHSPLPRYCCGQASLGLRAGSHWQNYDYELNEIFFTDLDVPKPDLFLEAAGASAAETIGNTIHRMDAVLLEQATRRAARVGRYE